jgi:phenol 2-monooxygenase
MDIGALPALLLPRKGQHGLIDYEKAFCPDMAGGPDVFDHRGIDRARGALLIVRPDQFIAKVQPLRDFDAIAEFFDGFMI